MFWSSIVKKRVLKRLGCLKKICFPWTVEVDKMGREIVEKLPDELERYRRNRQRLTEDSRKSLISHIYLPWSKEWIVQFGSFYSQIFLKLFPFTKKTIKVWFIVFFHIFLLSYAMISQIFSLRKAWSFGSPCRFGYWERSQ